MSEEVLQQATYPPTPSLVSKMSILDDQIGRAIAYANKKCQKFRTGDIPYSPEFIQINNERRFWLLLIRRFYGRNISNTTIRRLADKVKVDNPYSIDMIEAKYQLKLARQCYKEFILRAKTVRTVFLEELAAANALTYNLKKENVLRRIMNEEEQRAHNSRMRTCYKKKRFAQRLDSVDVNINGQ